MNANRAKWAMAGPEICPSKSKENLATASPTEEAEYHEHRHAAVGHLSASRGNASACRLVRPWRRIRGGGVEEAHGGERSGHVVDGEGGILDGDGGRRG
jgi:hypothetical protein